MNYTKSTALIILLLTQVVGGPLWALGILRRNQVVLRPLIVVQLRYHLLCYSIDLCRRVISLNVREHFSRWFIWPVFRVLDTVELIFRPLSVEKIIGINHWFSLDMLGLYTLLVILLRVQISIAAITGGERFKRLVLVHLIHRHLLLLVLHLLHLLRLELRIPFKLKWQLIYLDLILLKGLINLLQSLDLLVKSRYATFQVFYVALIHCHLLHVLKVFLRNLASILLKLSMKIDGGLFLLVFIFVSTRSICSRVLHAVTVYVPIVKHLLLILFYWISLEGLLLRLLLHFGLKTIGLICLPNHWTLVWQIAVSRYYQLTTRFTVELEQILLMRTI